MKGNSDDGERLKYQSERFYSWQRAIHHPSELPFIIIGIRKARIESLERRVRELEGLVILAQRHETLMGMAVEGLRREMNGCAETVNGMDAMVKEHDVCVYLLMTKAGSPTNRAQKRPASEEEFEFEKK